MQINKEKIITINEAHALLKQRQKQGNLSYEQQNTLNYLGDLLKIDDKDAGALAKELKETGGLSEWQAVKVTDILPKKEEELKVILAGTGQVSDAAVKKCFEIVKEYRKAAKEPVKSRKVEPSPAAEEEQKAAANVEVEQKAEQGEK